VSEDESNVGVGLGVVMSTTVEVVGGSEVVTAAETPTVREGPDPDPPEPTVQNPARVASHTSSTLWQHAVTPLLVQVWTPTLQEKALHSGTPFWVTQVSPISQQPSPSEHKK
jgi:hypothetical protein